MSERQYFELTVKLRYHGHKENYTRDDDTPCETPEEMAALDLASLEEGVLVLGDFLYDGEILSRTIVPVDPPTS